MHNQRFLYTRQDIIARTDLSDDILSFWIKQGLIRSQGGGGGAGRHRLFDFMQLQLAGLLAELRKHGVNIGALRGFAALVHHAAALAEESGLSAEGLEYAANGAAALLKFRNGRAVEIFDRESRCMKRATSESEILTDRASYAEVSDPSDILKIAAQLAPEDILPARLYRDLDPDVADCELQEEWVWTLAMDENGEWHVGIDHDAHVRAPDGLENASSYIVLRVSKILRDVRMCPFQRKGIEDPRLVAIANRQRREETVGR